MEVGLGQVIESQFPDEFWSRISGYSPILRRHIRVYAHAYRGKRWYILRDDTNGRHLRLDSAAYQFVGLMDGSRSINTLYRHLAEQDLALSKEEIGELLSQLIHFGALRGIGERASDQLLEQFYSDRRNSIFRRLVSPLVIRFPLYNPDRLLTAMVATIKPICRPVVAAAIIIVMMIALVAAFGQWDGLKAEFTQGALKPSNLILLWLLFPLVKAFHEFAHALFIKSWGGEVNEMGITLLVLTPIPYVDASAAWSFRSKRKRIMVSAAGVFAELLLASLAMIFWMLSEPGLARDCAFGILLIGSVNTVFFNANPLLKFDGYYLLQDWLEIPNFYSRSAKYLKFLIKRYLLGVSLNPPSFADNAERAWLIVYGILSAVYRVFILTVIVVMLVDKYLLLGVLIGMLAIYQQLIKPLFASWAYISGSAEIEHRRVAVLRAVGLCTGLIILLALVPMPSTTRIQGVVWVPAQGEIFAESSGFVESVYVQPGAPVSRGDPLLRLTNQQLQRDVKVLAADVDALEIQANLSRVASPASYMQISLDLESSQAELLGAHVAEQALTVSAATGGQFVVESARDLSGHYYAQGDLIGHIVNPQELVVRAVIPEADSGRLLDGIVGANVRLAEEPGQVLRASLIRDIPSADHRLPAVALGVGGGGNIPVSVDDPSKLTTMDRVFHLQLSLPEGTGVFGVGERAYVTLHHHAEPLAHRWYRGFQRLFLKNFS